MMNVLSRAACAEIFLPRMARFQQIACFAPATISFLRDIAIPTAAWSQLLLRF
jgi:hypothetical protein